MHAGQHKLNALAGKPSDDEAKVIARKQFDEVCIVNTDAGYLAMLICRPCKPRAQSVVYPRVLL